MRLQETATNGEKCKKQTLPTKNKPKREEGAGLFERENSFLFWDLNS